VDLSQPITIRGIEFKNRLVMAPMQVGVGMRSRRARAYYKERAIGGVGTIIMAGTPVDVFATDDAWGQSGGVDAFIEGIRPVIEDIQSNGTRVGIQLWHGNQFPAGTAGLESRGEAVAPSATDAMRELTVPEVETIITRFAQASAGARRAGFDFVEVHGAHGYLVCQFFSALANRRQDAYGAGIAGRMKFGTEIVSAIRAEVGDYPIFYRIGAWEDIKGGIKRDDAVRFAAELEKAGVDVMDVSLGSVTGSGLTASPGPEHHEGTLVPLAEAVKRVVGIPVIGVGRFRTPEVAQGVIEQGKVDMIAIGRQLIADPHWAVKAVTGRDKDITPCISCNTCFEPVREGLRLRCSVNPFVGREADLKPEPAEKPKRVMVVGGGPGGMEAAGVAAGRGHDVTLFERQPVLGGQLIPASAPPYKHELLKLRDYLVRQMEKGGVRVRLGADVTPEIVRQERPDVFISAIGPVSMVPDIHGMDRIQVATDLEVLSGDVEMGERVVVIGGELTGCETADYLSDRGKNVTVVRRGPEMAIGVFPSLREALLARLEGKGVVLMPGIQEYVEMTEAGLVVIDADGVQRTLEADGIALATGSTPNDRLARSVEGLVGEVRRAGDCVEPGRIIDAIQDGARIGYEV
jgi:2,4-dienoyl-CoA reductase-like NADH-dependent reductase (Old Yellow Enzyme family)